MRYGGGHIKVFPIYYIVLRNKWTAHITILITITTTIMVIITTITNKNSIIGSATMETRQAGHSQSPSGQETGAPSPLKSNPESKSTGLEVFCL